MSRPRSLSALLSAYLDRCFAREEQPRVKEFAHFANVSRDTLHNWSLKEFGKPPSTVLREERLRRADELLDEPDLTTNDVAYRAGYGSRSNFFREFRRRRGHSPRSPRR